MSEAFYRLDEDSSSALFWLHLYTMVTMRLSETNRDWLVEKAFDYFDDGMEEVLKDIRSIMPSGSIPQTTPPKVRHAFQHLLKTTWLWHLMGFDLQNAVTSRLRMAQDLCRERYTTAADQNERPTPSDVREGIKAILRTTWMFALLGPRVEDVTECLELALKEAEKGQERLQREMDSRG